MALAEAEFVTLKANSEFEISTQEPWIIRRKEDGFILKFSKTNSGYLIGWVGGQVENQTYPNIRIESRAESRFINQQLNNRTDTFYSRNYLILPISVQKKTGTQIVYLTDSNDCRVGIDEEITRQRFRQQTN
ncbi:MAG: hypothetical protein EZS28_034631 [Streblomastix strix]|uniref:Uncharacterized protein n=1 Tax=Streblomastix strix TaxID=222440 RepID=A0A5J4UII1_9EUKA|nr:MAG: hypothetical protein EZS28_034631 [Streblomastix strix]